MCSLDIDKYQQAHVHSALVQIAKKVLKVDILGSYPVTVL
jgi:prephenate dehydratase